MDHLDQLHLEPAEKNENPLSVSMGLQIGDSCFLHEDTGEAHKLPECTFPLMGCQRGSLAPGSAQWLVMG